MALRDRRRNHDGGGDLPSCCRADEVAGGHSNTDRGQHPRIDGAAHRRARSDGQLRERRRVLATHVRAVGIRAAVGVPVIVDGRVWGLAAVGSARPGPMPADTEARISGFAELVASVVVAGYRDEQKRQLLSEASQRPFLIDSLLEGRAVDRWSLCEVASHLRLPADGPFVVIVAEVPAVGIEALPEVESKLRSRDVYSAWRLQPDMQVGIVHVKSDRHLDQILGLVSSVGDKSSRRQCALRRSA